MEAVALQPDREQLDNQGEGMSRERQEEQL